MAEMKEKIEDVGGKVKGGADRMGDQATGFVGSVKEKARDVAAGAADLAGKAKDTAQGWASSVGDAAVHTKDKAQEVASAAVDKAGDIGQELTRLIRSHPMPALLAGVGVGFLLGVALRRQSS